jgi:hypothetical protein
MRAGSYEKALVIGIAEGKVRRTDSRTGLARDLGKRKRTQVLACRRYDPYFTGAHGINSVEIALLDPNGASLNPKCSPRMSSFASLEMIASGAGSSRTTLNGRATGVVWAASQSYPVIPAATAKKIHLARFMDQS